ncbi:MAG TPA: trimethylamine methyltransferase family protein [Bacillota bacterium]|jgi:trimethylamine--corrinoid protein Co-methyltransferase|nr:trimethylamine methyltransferase family protein [Bacillota bacterium]
MEKFTFNGQPRLRLLSDEQIKLIHEKALYILETTGVLFESDEALKILKDHGADVDFDRRVAKFKPEMVIDAIKKAPSGIKLYTRDGELAADLSGNKIHFDPVSAPIKILESDGKTVRQSVAQDLANISKVNDALENIALQASACVLYDVPKLIGDCYRVYIMLKNSPKAMITGAFSVHGISYMRDMLAAVVGGYDELREKPRAVFDICPSPPLKWTHISSQNIIDCARYGLPLETVSMPMPGAATPATLAGSIVVHTAETLSGLVLAQVINPGTPVIYGGAPVHFDMRTGTTPLSAIEATMIAAAYAQMGKYYGLPTHTYACLSDSMIIDAQAGLETSMSGIVAQLAGINVISGVGGLEFVSTVSLEKLVIDNEICGMALRLDRGIDITEETLAVELIRELGPGGDYLSTEHTFAWFKKEPYIPSSIIERRDRKNWEADGAKSVFEKAQEKVKDLLANHRPVPLDAERADKLDRVTAKIMDELGIDSLPLGPK